MNLRARELVNRFLKLHRWVVLGTELVIFFASGLFAFLLRFDFNIPQQFVPYLHAGLVIWPISKFIVFASLGLDRGWWRYVSIHDLVLLAGGNLIGSLLAAGSLLWLAPGFPRSVYLLDLIVCFLLTGCARLAARVLADRSKRRQAPADAQAAVIYGAGDAGVSLLRELRQNLTLPYRVLGFIDDDPRKVARTIQGVKVLGNGRALASIARRRSVKTVLIAIPSSTGLEMTRILQHCSEARVSYKTVPGLGEVMSKNGLATQIRDVAVEDLLGRSPVHLEQDTIRAKIEGKMVLVTGAAGSIGSELCRQIARFGPQAIVGYELAETPLFDLEQEMRSSFPELLFHPEIGSIQDRKRLAEVFWRHAPSIVFHAAAYKHVPMMEAHILQAVENNVLGTWEVALAAADYHATDFVMISSDKAVHPTSIMGATKRVAELVINSLQNGETKYVSVRFGNVLGSNGSVVPIFRKQITAGGPLTVTHPEMRRYFMTIPEAAQLVIQASTMGKGGEIFVLDMGEPVRIVDLARRMVLLSGLRPDEDIKIVFSGVRPGEKLYEELSAHEESTLPTYHPKIKIFGGNGAPVEEMAARLSRLREALVARDRAGLLLALKDIVPTYNPSTQVLRQMLVDGKKAVRAVPILTQELSLTPDLRSDSNRVLA
jgi:FlaA1/EpsC-like NDP-sugar epimerase